MKKDKAADLFLAQLKKIPIVQVACEKVGVSRNSVYRWRSEDPEFAAAMEVALAEGEALVNDMGESQLISMIRDKNWAAISFWLRHRNPKFRDRIEVTANVKNVPEQLTPEQQAVVEQALKLASLAEPADQATGEQDSGKNT